MLRIPARELFALILFAVLWLVTAPPVGAQAGAESGWTQFRGPNATGVAVVTKAPPIEFGPDRHMLWKGAVPPGHSSPVIWGDRLFLTAFDAEQQRLLLLALDRKTGRTLWRQEVTYETLGDVHAVNTPATATPVVDGERVYAYFAAAGLFAYDLDGKPAWNLRLPFAQTRYGSGTSPVVAGNLVLLNRDSVTDPFLMAVDRRSGAVLWRMAHDASASPIGNSGYATPVVLGDQVILHRPGKVESYELATGTRRWWVNASGSGTSTPTVLGSVVYVGTWSPLGEDDQLRPLPDFATAIGQHDRDRSGTLSRAELAASGIVVASRPDVPDVPGATFGVPFTMADRDKDGELTAEEWGAFLGTAKKMTVEHGLLAIRTDGRGDVTSSHVIWRENRSIPEVPSPLVLGERVYMVRNGGVLSCLDVTSGKVVYRGRLGTPGPFFSSPIAAGRHLYMGSSDGVMAVVAAGDTLNVLARNDLGEPIFATPAVSSEGVLYVRTASALYAFGDR